MSGDYQLEDTVYLPFTTRAFATGIPTALAAGEVQIYEDASLTQITGAETLTVSLDSVAGFNMVQVAMTTANGFESGKSYTLVLSAGTVDSVSVVGEIVGHFTIEMSAAALDLANATDGLGAIKAETALILVDTAEIGAAGAGLTNINLPNQTMDIVGTITGDLSGSVGSVTGAVGSVTATTSADVVSISGDTVAADNLELQYDTTGLTGDTFPSTQSQLSGIANVGAAVNRASDIYVLTTGVQSSGTIANVAALDGTNHEHTDTAGAMDLYYQFNVGAGIPTSATMSGYLNGNNDSLGVYGYDWVAAGWVQIGTLVGQTGATNNVNSYSLFTDMVGTGANTGLVRLRFFVAAGLTTATLAVDQIYCSFAQGSAGYEGGAVWVDTSVSNTNTVVGIDGTSTNPVSTMGAANTIATATNLNKFQIAPGSDIVLATSQTSQIFEGSVWTLDLGGQDISNSNFIGCEDVSGTGTSPTGEVHFDHCTFDGLGTTLGGFHMDNCGLAGALTLSEAGDYVLNHCYSEVAGAGTPTIDFGAALGNTNLNMRDYSGGVQINNKDATGTDQMSLEGNGQLIVAASSSGAISLRGNWQVTNTGGATITRDDNSTSIAAIEADTNELQTDWADGTGRLDLILDIIAADTTTDIPALINGLDDVTAAEVLTQVNAALDTAIAELGVAAPTATPTIRTGLMLLYMAMRNKRETTASVDSIMNDAGTAIASSVLSDDAVTFTKNEYT
jgi:hypothetical protein